MRLSYRILACQKGNTKEMLMICPAIERRNPFNGYQHRCFAAQWRTRKTKSE